MGVERVSALKTKLEKLEEAFIYQHAIDRATYERRHDESKKRWHLRRWIFKKHESKASTSMACSDSRSA
jgi:hypothetical protein